MLGRWLRPAPRGQSQVLYIYLEVDDLLNSDELAFIEVGESCLIGEGSAGLDEQQLLPGGIVNRVGYGLELAI